MKAVEDKIKKEDKICNQLHGPADDESSQGFKVEHKTIIKKNYPALIYIYIYIYMLSAHLFKYF